MTRKSIRRWLAALACSTVLATPLAASSQPPAEGSPLRAVDPSVIADRKGPNVLVVLMDDVGFGADSTFGGPIPTPNLDALAAKGLRYNRFNTTAMCSPTRASLLTGRNHHRVEMGSITNLAVGEPGYTSVIPRSAATIGRVLGMNGYSTAWFGKNHLTPAWEQTAAGPFDRWPTGLGFDYFYGFMDGASDQFAPTMVEGTRTLDPQYAPGKVMDRDLADHIIDWIGTQRSAAPGKPFLVYLAPGTAHEPHQAPADWLARFRGKFDQGWDKVREQTYARQKRMGIIPANARLTPRPDILPAWDSLPPDAKRFAARQMEANAAQRAYFDDQFGRIVADLKANGQWDNTLVLFIDGDNGASGEGGPNGTVLGLLNRPNETLAYDLAHIDEIGGPRYAGNYSAAWGWAMNAPFPWFKQAASQLGGQRDGMVVSWPARIKANGEVRSQYGHVNDIAPTIYEAAGITPPAEVDGVKQLPIDGTSLVYSFTDAKAPSRHHSQYYEMLGNVAMYSNGWMASLSPPNIMWKPGYGANKSWQLYNLDTDFSQSQDLSAKYPAKLAELRAQFETAGKDNHFQVLDVPISTRGNPAMRPSRFNGRTSFAFSRSDRPVLDDAFPAIVNRNWQMSVDVTLKSGTESGTIISQGGYPNGWGLFFFEGRPAFLYRNEPQPFAQLEAGRALGPGQHRIEITMEPHSARPGGPARMSLSIDGGPPITQELPATVPAFWGANGIGIGREVGTAADDRIARPFVFEGQMGPVTIQFKQ